MTSSFSASSNARPIAVVFGGTGFVGHTVVQELARAGYAVRIPTRDMDKASSLKQSGQAGQITPIYAPNPSDAGLAALMKGAHLVVNLIGTLKDSRKNSFLALHVELAARFARMAKAVGVKDFVHISAMGATEQAASTYMKTKASGQKAVQTFFPDAAILQPNQIYGPRDHFLNKRADWLRFLPILPMAGNGKVTIQPIYVGDVAKAVLACTKNAETRGKIFELNGPNPLTHKEILRLIMEITGHERFILPVPWWILRLAAHVPFSPLSPDLIKSYRSDYIASDTPQITDLGITPRKMRDAMEWYLI